MAKSTNANDEKRAAAEARAKARTEALNELMQDFCRTSNHIMDAFPLLHLPFALDKCLDDVREFGVVRGLSLAIADTTSMWTYYARFLRLPDLSPDAIILRHPKCFKWYVVAAARRRQLVLLLQINAIGVDAKRLATVAPVAPSF